MLLGASAIAAGGSDRGGRPVGHRTEHDARERRGARVRDRRARRRDQHERRGGGLTPTVAFSSRVQATRRLRVPVTFAICDSNGQLLPVRGNPARLHLRSDRLARGRAAAAMWWRRNWCGWARAPFVYDVRVGRKRIGFTERSAPRCDGGGAGASTLSLLIVCPQPENADLLPWRSRAAALRTCRRPR